MLGGSGASREQGQREAAEAEQQVQQEAEAWGPRAGAVPDPGAEGEPVPDRADATPRRASGDCARDELTLMLGQPDAAAGHRALPIRAVNIGDSACTLRGYPDIAFEDQNGHLLAAEVTHGGSSMAQDPGSRAVQLEPGASAITYLGWNAESTQEALVSKSVHAAPLAGDVRDRWELESPLDIVPGSEVAVAAWKLDPASASDTSG